MSVPFRGKAFLIAAVFLVSWIVPAAAQDSGSEVCPLEPLTLPLWDATPAADVAATPVPAPQDFEPDDEGVIAGIEILVICINSGEPRLANAIFTDRYLAERFAAPTTAYLPAFEQALDRNFIETVEPFSLESVDDIEWLPDGRVSVTIALTNGLTLYTDTLTLAWQNGFWLIDDVTELDPPLQGISPATHVSW